MLLIAPVGIEMKKKTRIHLQGKTLLIAPVGIEIC